MFREALANQTLGAFFRLIEQFRTQDEPAFCGLSTLTMALNALNVDPGQTWKGPWRWYHESMLNCCEPIAAVKEQGITWPKFVCLARCNGVHVDAHRARGDDGNLALFRSFVQEAACQDIGAHNEEDEAALRVLLVSYSRRVFNQTGDGHYSPIGGYHKGKDGREHVLILDVARFKYPPHWVPLEDMYESMKREDKDTGMPRGFVMLSRQDQGGWLTLAANSAEPQTGAQLERTPSSSGVVTGSGGCRPLSEVPAAFLAAVSTGLQATSPEGDPPSAHAVARDAFQLAREFCASSAMPWTVSCYEALPQPEQGFTPAESVRRETAADAREQSQTELEFRAALLNALSQTADRFARELELQRPDLEGHGSAGNRVMSPIELETAILLAIPLNVWEAALPDACRDEAMQALDLGAAQLPKALRLEVATLRSQFHDMVNRDLHVDPCSC